MQAVLGLLEAGEVAMAEMRLYVGLVADQLPERVDTGRQLAKRLGEVAQIWAPTPRRTSCRPPSPDPAHQTPDRHRGVLQRLQALAKAGLDVGGPDGADVEPAALLGLEQRGPDLGDAVGDAP